MVVQGKENLNSCNQPVISIVGSHSSNLQGKKTNLQAWLRLSLFVVMEFKVYTYHSQHCISTQE